MLSGTRMHFVRLFGALSCCHGFERTQSARDHDFTKQVQFFLIAGALKLAARLHDLLADIGPRLKRLFTCKIFLYRVQALVAIIPSSRLGTPWAPCWTSSAIEGNLDTHRETSSLSMADAGDIR